MRVDSFLRGLFEVSLLVGVVCGAVIGISLRRIGGLKPALLHQWTWSDLQAYRRLRLETSGSLFWYYLFITSLTLSSVSLGLLLARGCRPSGG